MQLPTVVYFLIWAGLFALVMRFGCGAHVMGHAHRRDESSSDPGPLSGKGAGVNVPERRVDPVCGMSVKASEAKTAVHEGQVYYFCSQACRDKFEASPDKYAKPGTTVDETKEHHHGACC